MTNLVVCTGCSRHVRVGDPACPFCGSGASERLARRTATPAERLGRAALQAFAVATVTAACGGSGAGAHAPAAPPPPPTQAALPGTAPPLSETQPAPDPQPPPAPSTAASTAPPAWDGSVVAAYGGPPRPEQPVAVAPLPADRGKVEVTTVTVKGGTIDNAPQVAEGMRVAFGRCYSKGLTADPSAQGQVTLNVRIGAAGQVLGVSVQRTTNVPAQVASCMTVRAGSAEFAPPRAAKGQVTLDMTVTLTP